MYDQHTLLRDFFQINYMFAEMSDLTLHLFMADFLAVFVERLPVSKRFPTVTFPGSTVMLIIIKLISPSIVVVFLLVDPSEAGVIIYCYIMLYYYQCTCYL